MSVQRRSIPASDADLEATAELPVLDVAAFESAQHADNLSATDTWVAPLAGMPGASAEVERRIRSEDSVSLRSDLAAAAANRSRLGDELRNVSENLRELEARLTKKTERLALLEREIDGVRAERQAAEAREALQVSALETARAVLAAASARAEAAEHTLAERDGSLLQATARIGTLERQVEATTQRAESLRADLERARSDAHAGSRELEERSNSIVRLENASEQRERALSAAGTEIGELQERLSKYLEALQSIEVRRSVYEQMISGLEQEVAAREAHIAEHETELAFRADRIQELDAALAARVTRERELDAITSGQSEALAARAAEIGSAQHAHKKLAAAHASLEHTLRQRAEQIEQLHRERDAAKERIAALNGDIQSLKPLEGRTRALEAELAAERAERNKREERIKGLTVEIKALTPVAQRVPTLEVELAAAHAECGIRDARIAALLGEMDSLRPLADRLPALETEIAAARAEHERLAVMHRADFGASESLNQELEGRLSAARESSQALEAELERTRTALAERTQAAQSLQTILDERSGRDATSAQQLHDLQTQLADHEESLRVLQEELRQLQQRAQELEADRLAGEDTIHRLEADLRSKESQLVELRRTSEDWRTNAEQARAKADAREAVIRRFEADAANSVAALGNIQQSMQRLDPLATTGDEPGIEGAARLLIRSDGESEVVHVLGRRTTIGRTPENDLQIDTKFISRHHAVILAGPIYTVIEDLNSTNGVLVNNRRVSRKTLKDGDAVMIGKSLFRFAVRPQSPRVN
ncbi:MAG TPA: FHA domain-containing protein [Steroidobacteraceae bacterium]